VIATEERVQANGSEPVFHQFIEFIHIVRLPDLQAHLLLVPDIAPRLPCEAFPDLVDRPREIEIVVKADFHPKAIVLERPLVHHFGHGLHKRIIRRKPGHAFAYLIPYPVHELLVLGTAHGFARQVRDEAEIRKVGGRRCGVCSRYAEFPLVEQREDAPEPVAREDAVRV
jgi:hypothetical protein